TYASTHHLVNGLIVPSQGCRKARIQKPLRFESCTLDTLEHSVQDRPLLFIQHVIGRRTDKDATLHKQTLPMPSTQTTVALRIAPLLRRCCAHVDASTPGGGCHRGCGATASH